MKKVQFKIEHIALQPADPIRAMRLLKKLGLTEWVNDEMTLFGSVWQKRDVVGVVDLDFNYQADCDRKNADGTRRPIELEIMNCSKGPNWMDGNGGDFISHFGMQVTLEEFYEFEKIFASEGVAIAQNTVTIAHKNEHIRDSRRYKKVTFDTRSIIGVDLEFNVLLSI
jgi:hypothetical protein